MRHTAFELAAVFTLLAGSAGAAPRPPVRHVIYLHGRIAEGLQIRRPHSPQFGV
jgi:hypothetical protein